MREGAAINGVVVVIRRLGNAIFERGIVFRDEFGDGLGGNPWARPIHLALAVSLHRVPLHAGLVMLFRSHERRRTVLVSILG